MGEQPRVSLVAHVREIGEIEDGGDLEEKGSAGGDKQEQEKSSTTEPVMIAEGLRPLSRKIVQKIQNWEFTDMEELLPNPRSNMDIVLPQRQDGVLIIQSIENLKRKKPRITGYPQWVETFAVYTAVIAQKYPQAIPDLMAYQVLIKEASTLGGARWLSYDREFREKAAAKKLKHWGERDPNLWAKFFSNISPSAHICHYCGGEEHVTEDCKYIGQQAGSKKQMPSPAILQNAVGGLSTARPKKPKGPCFPFNNKGACDRIPPCPFPHVCINCGEEHPARVCPHPSRKVARRDVHMV